MLISTEFSIEKRHFFKAKMDPPPPSHLKRPDVHQDSWNIKILPCAYGTWIAYRTSHQAALTCRIRAAFLRHMAGTGRFPSWTTGVIPPAWVITTRRACERLVSLRRQQAISTLDTVATILEEQSIEHKARTNALHVDLQKEYWGVLPVWTHAGSIYSLSAAIGLARRLVDIHCDCLNRGLRLESKALKADPEAALWLGIPLYLRGASPGFNEAVQVNEQQQSNDNDY